MSHTPVVSSVIALHAEEAAGLYTIRTKAITAPQGKIRHISGFDDRIAAHLDGLAVAGDEAWSVCIAALEQVTAGTTFVAGVFALQRRSAQYLSYLYALAEGAADAQRGLVGAYGWVEKAQLQGLVAGLLASPNTFLRLLGISACGIHRVDFGKVGIASLNSPASALLNRALRAAGELGRRDLMPNCLQMVQSEDDETRFWAAWSAVLLGDRGRGLEVLTTFGEAPGVFQTRAFAVALQTLDGVAAREWLRAMARNPDNVRLLIRGSGIAGDPMYVPWLIRHMVDAKTARLAGEAFSLVTGLDLAHAHLDRKRPDDPLSGPNDDPNDLTVAMDEDDGLPWPDSERISAWWQANGSRFEVGTRYFLGGPVDSENCLRVLKHGFLRQRILAAHYLTLLEPGIPLFEWRSPAYRQERLLAAMI